MTNRLILSLLKIIILSLQFLINIYVDRSYMHCSRAHCGGADSLLEARKRKQFIPKMTQYYGLFISPQKIDFLNLSYTNIITNQNYQFELLND